MIRNINQQFEKYILCHYLENKKKEKQEKDLY